MINGLDLIVAQERLADRRREALAAALRQATRAPLAPSSHLAPLRERLDRMTQTGSRRWQSMLARDRRRLAEQGSSSAAGVPKGASVPSGPRAIASCVDCGGSSA